MSKMFFYADNTSAELLLTGRPKALMLGSDFGYGNFGDVLQHVGSVSRVHAVSDLAVVSIFALEAIGRFEDAVALRLAYRVDALIFVASTPLSREQALRLGVSQVLKINDVAVLHLYGGGFLNEMWGDFSLNIAEFLLRRLRGIRYFISGQQVDEGYSHRVAAHIAEFRPLLVGLRDRDSLRNVIRHGVDAEFSFDDAAEPLIGLSDRFALSRGAGAFIHMNSSGYTGNDSALLEVTRHLEQLVERVGRDTRPVLFQAFQDAREEVVDSLETVKRLERAFPFDGCQTVLLVEGILGTGEARVPLRLEGQFGYSCSYHITMWLQFNRIPCWLRGSNSYYDQKRRSLGVAGDFESFLTDMPLVDHGPNLAAREAWLGRFEAALSDAPPASNHIEWDAVEGAGTFNFKGEPRLTERLQRSWKDLQEVQSAHAVLSGTISQLSEERDELSAERDSLLLATNDGRAEVISLQDELAQAMALIGESQMKIARLEEQNASEADLCMRLRRSLEASESRLLMFGEKLTSVGADARYFREQYEGLHWTVQSARSRAETAESQLVAIVASRSWRLTRPLRAISRLLSTGTVDVEGSVGLFEIARRVGNRLPLPLTIKRRLGGWLRRFRR